VETTPLPITPFQTGIDISRHEVEIGAATRDPFLQRLVGERRALLDTVEAPQSRMARD
jgi:hypothetical protein